ncbi:serine-rich coiled-coil domain-containing protein 1 isoform X2 [Haemorhous mexicanus]|uniref:serine-rich coiled-coil domain-containing protein 1 isoform X2 n=1 Tax=Haemorhous mexicanus TaxID=30427 RepID=UPI0028BE3247|nr:serine-rich coiled-coil domain-containing protein 1 isoform X2 [Haemorhous mexicanus]
MGDSGSRRSTLVSRLPIFRRSVSRRHDSLPSSPSSASAIGVHTSSPSSTNSSSGSTGKRRSIFRTPSISFHNKKGSEQKPDSASQNVNISNGAQSSLSTFQKLSLDEHIKSRGRHSVGFGSSRNKKITRSLTDDFEKGKEPSANKNVFINCISSGKNEGDDSGFAEERSRYSVKQSTRKLLTKSFSSHYRFSKPVPESQSVSSVQQPRCLLEVKSYVESEPVMAKSSPPCSAETTDCMGSSLQSPLLSADLTAAQTPSDFIALTEDSVSEADALPSSGPGALLAEDFGHDVSTSQVFFNPAAAPERERDTVRSAGHSADVSPVSHASLCSVESSTLFKTSVADQTKAPLQANGLHINDARHIEKINSENAHLETLTLQRSEEPVALSPKARGLSGSRDESTPSKHMRNTIPVVESNTVLCSEPQSFKIQQGYESNHSKVDLANSLSPYREGRFVEKRLRSSSEGTAGGSRLIIKPKDGNAEELNSLRKQRASSSSSKMNSMDVLNNLGSCELDEDDLMLDLEFLEEQHHQRSVCREDSYQSIVSCAAVVLTPVETTVDARKKEQMIMPDVSKQNLSLKLSKEVEQGEARYPRVSQLAGSPSVEWPFTGLEEGGGIESLPFRLMLQDCTAVKTLLLKMKRVLQESTDMSPAGSTASLPVSPLPEEPLFFKDGIKDECSVLKLQLKERDELIAQLREELEKAQCFQKALTSQADKSTQTELVGHDTTYPIRMVSQNLSTRDRKSALTPTEDPFRHPPGNQAAAYESKSCQLSNLCLSSLLKEKEIVEAIKHTRGTYETLAPEAAQNGLAVTAPSPAQPASKADGFPAFSGAPKDQSAVPRQHSTFTGRLGQPPRGPISLHMYSRKNVFLHHNLHTAELQTLGQQDG